jgi:riboflavin kinase/FMN adenylyltransferase
MQIQQIAYPITPVYTERVVVALGFFDGVHLGHQKVIQRAKAMAETLGAVPAVMTFDPHPRQVLGHAKMTRFLTPLAEKLERFAELGVQKVYVMKFDHTFARLSKEQFVQEILVPLGVKGVVTGFNFTFGHMAEGKAMDLFVLGQGRFAVEVVDPVYVGELVASSSRTRQMLESGKPEAAADLLGRPYLVRGKVVSGDKRGRLLGFPTANLALLDPYFVPKYGVYLVRVQFHEHSAFGVMNIGVRPTFRSSTPEERWEVHILDYQGDLYNEILSVEFLHFIREEKRFSSVEELKMQIQQDVEKAKSWVMNRVK